MAYYIDTSALVKFVVAEPESSTLHRWLIEEDPVLVSCDLARTELIRAVRLAGGDMVRARLVLSSITLTTLSGATFTAAALLEPPLLRSLDAVHIAAALELGDDLDGLVTYDTRMADAAAHQGIPRLAPVPDDERAR